MSTNILCKDEILPLRFITELTAVLIRVYVSLINALNKTRSLMMIALYYRKI